MLRFSRECGEYVKTDYMGSYDDLILTRHCFLLLVAVPKTDVSFIILSDLTVAFERNSGNVVIECGEHRFLLMFNTLLTYKIIIR